MEELREFEVRPLAFESLGVRSMCTYVKTSDIRILLDAGVSLCPNHFGLPPHPIEYSVLRDKRNLILKVAKKADVLTVSHYHFDHHTPSFIDWASNWSSRKIVQETYEGKIVLTKSYKSKINTGQRKRGWMFHKTVGKKAAHFEFADRRIFKFGATTLRFSEPVYHGHEGSKLGWVLMVTIEHKGEKLLFAPDIQGPMYKEPLKK